MTLYQVFLQGAQFIGGYIFATQGTEACGDTVQRFFGLGYLMIEVVATFLYPFFSFGCQFQFQILVDNSFDDVECEFTGPYMIDIFHTRNSWLTTSNTSFSRSQAKRSSTSASL